MHSEFQLISANQGYEVIKTVWSTLKTYLEAGNQAKLIITDVDKNRDQEQKYHALIGEIAKQAEHLGSKWSADDWKRLLIQQFIEDTTGAKDRIIPSLSGLGIVQLGFQSRKFSKQQASDFIEFLYSWGAQNGITFSSEHEKKN